MIPQIYHGSAPPATHEIIAKHSSLGDGVCLNLYEGYERVQLAFKRIESLGLKIFLDNGSFERFKAYLEGRLTEEQYSSPSAADLYFHRITRAYKDAIKSSTNPANLIITMPEVIGRGNLTSELQSVFVQEYLAWSSNYGVQLIMALQFDPKAFDWDTQARAAANRLVKLEPSGTTRVGIPFGKDFARLQNPKSWFVITRLFSTGGALHGRKAHMFGLGSLMKHEKYAKGHAWVASVDASTLKDMSRFGSYISRSGFMLDVRDLKEERDLNKAKAALAILKGEGFSVDKWRSLSTTERFRKNLENFDHAIAMIYSGKGQARRSTIADLMSFVGGQSNPGVKTLALPSARKRVTTSSRLRDKPDAYFKTLDNLVVNFVAFRDRLAKSGLQAVNLAEAYYPDEYVFTFDVQPVDFNLACKVVDEIDHWVRLSRVRRPGNIQIQPMPPGNVTVRVKGGIGWFHDLDTATTAIVGINK